MNSSTQTTTHNTVITLPQITTPFVNPIPNLLLIKGDLDLFYGTGLVGHWSFIIMVSL